MHSRLRRHGRDGAARVCAGAHSAHAREPAGGRVPASPRLVQTRRGALTAGRSAERKARDIRIKPPPARGERGARALGAVGAWISCRRKSSKVSLGGVSAGGESASRPGKRRRSGRSSSKGSARSSGSAGAVRNASQIISKSCGRPAAPPTTAATGSHSFLPRVVALYLASTRVR